MSKFLREPLLHFLLIGAMLFGVSAWISRGAPVEAPAGAVSLTENEVKWLRETWVKQWQREPDVNELRGLVKEYLTEELLSREAREMGLDENDTVVRRRLAQKMEFVLQDTARTIEPPEEELREYFQAHLDRYQQPARVSFLQDNPMLPHEMTGDQVMVAGVFGQEFARKIFALEPGTGRISSPYGEHVVRVIEKQPARSHEFAGIRERVLEDWQRDQQTKAKELFYEELFKKYNVVADDSVKHLVAR